MEKTQAVGYTKEDIFAQLEAMGAPRDRAVLMHSSLRLIGQIEGGAEALLDALIEYFTAEGGLFCVPTHTWHNIGKEITLDMSDPHTCLGAFSDLAAADARAVRTENPTHSMAVFGESARVAAFIKDEAGVLSGTAPNSCYGKLYDMGGYVLLVGVSHNRNTYLHSVDERIGVPNRLTRDLTDVTVKRADGSLLRHKMYTHYTDFSDDVSLRFPKYETPFRYHGAIKDGFLGNAPTQLCDARVMKEVMERIFLASGDTDPLADEKPIPTKLYC